METNNSDSAGRVGSSVKIQLYAVFRAHALREFGLHGNDAQYVAFRIIVNDYAGRMLQGFIGGNHNAPARLIYVESSRRNPMDATAGNGFPFGSTTTPNGEPLLALR
jgi:hypothetical protein